MKLVSSSPWIPSSKCTVVTVHASAVLSVSSYHKIFDLRDTVVQNVESSPGKLSADPPPNEIQSYSKLSLLIRDLRFGACSLVAIAGPFHRR